MKKAEGFSFFFFFFGKLAPYQLRTISNSLDAKSQWETFCLFHGNRIPISTRTTCSIISLIFQNNYHTCLWEWNSLLIVFSMDRFPPGGQFRIKQPEPQTTRQRNRASILCNVLHSKLFILPEKKLSAIVPAICHKWNTALVIFTQGGPWMTYWVPVCILVCVFLYPNKKVYKWILLSFEFAVHLCVCLFGIYSQDFQPIWTKLDMDNGLSYYDLSLPSVCLVVCSGSPPWILYQSEPNRTQSLIITILGDDSHFVCSRVREETPLARC